MKEADNSLKSYIAEHPRMIGILFMMMLLLTQAGNAAANTARICSGP